MFHAEHVEQAELVVWMKSRSAKIALEHGRKLSREMVYQLYDEIKAEIYDRLKDKPDSTEFEICEDMVFEVTKKDLLDQCAKVLDYVCR